SLDKDQFRQVLVNLIQNGTEAISQDAQGEVVVEASGGSEHPFRIAITDNGAGIPFDLVTQVFQPLFTTKTKGTGLGLAIVQSLVERHEGTIEVNSHLGRGTTFTILLPSTAMTRAA